MTGGSLISCLLVTSVTALLPTGDHVCMVDESFKTTVRVEEPYQYRRRKTEWCFNVPPRCSKYDMAWSWRWVDKEVEETRQVPKCCKGYVAGPEDDDCRPFCSTPCKHGVCQAPDECSCEAGYLGLICEATCPRGTWGFNCSEVCDCKNGAFCDPVGGNCHCAVGWLGRKCDEPCPAGSHGIECQFNCDCGESIACHHITGDCILPTTSTTDSSTSTEPITTTTEETASSIETTTLAVNEAVTSISSTETILKSTPDSSQTFTTISELSVESYTTAINEYSRIEDAISSSTVEGLLEDFTLKADTDTSISTDKEEDLVTTELSHTTHSETSKEEDSFSTGSGNAGISEQEKRNEEGETRGGQHELAGLAITIVLSVLGAIILLIAVGGIALTRHRKTTNNEVQSTDLGVYKFYGEMNIPAKTLFTNPTYNCDEVDVRCDKPVLRTFTPTQDTFDAELREILEAHYDHPPSIVGQLSLSVEHLYDEISATYENSTTTPFTTFSYH